jgi:prepilin-type processing-associated H-X9-DG protein
VIGKVVVALGDRSTGEFDQVAGELFLSKGLGPIEAYGILQVGMDSWKSPLAFFDGHVKGTLLDVRRNPTAVLHIDNISGISEEIPLQGFTDGRLEGDLSLVNHRHPVDIPVRIYRFEPGVWGIEPIGSLWLSLDRLGLREQAADLRQLTSTAFDDMIRVFFRVELQRDS